ncbi:MAG: cytochrome b N-terminal domain-containing protein [Pirellulales bacterium]|nr:cytochrome b N-terminal domain-containing protein [Pirellulales bacterium]
MQKFLDWFNDRTGYRNWLASRRERALWDGPSWNGALVPGLCVLAGIECVSGLILMTIFSPSATASWASIHYIEQLPWGGFLRGLHYWGGQALIVLFAIYLLQMLLTASYRAPRELVWISGLLLFPLVVIWTLSGVLITGTQTAHGQIDVETNIVGLLPLVGPGLRKLILGGDAIGHLVVTHLYFVHVVLLPVVAGALAWFHIWQINRNQPGQTGTLSRGGPSDTDRPGSARIPYRPYQSIRNLLVSVLVLGMVTAAAWWLRAPRDMPADPGFEHIARPEWYFASLFQLRHYLTGPWEVVLTMAVPTVLLLLLILLPLFDRWLPKTLGLLYRAALLVVGLGGWALLTYISMAADLDPDDPEALKFQALKADQKRWAQRAWLLADHNAIPPEGAITLLRQDPKIQGPRLFKKHCASCHAHVDPSGQDPSRDIPADEVSAPNLYQFASREWIAGILDLKRITSDHYFGRTAFADGEMVGWVQENIADWEADLDEEELAEFRSQVQDVVVALSAEAALIAQKELDQQDAEQIQRGRAAFTEAFSCTDCHKIGDAGSLGSAPDLTGYGSREWQIEFIRDPAQRRFYRDTNDRMPSYAPADIPEEEHQLDQKTIEVIVDWLRGEWFEPPK